MKDVTYYMQLNTDFYIFKPLCYDPIDLFHTHNRSYLLTSPNAFQQICS